MIHVRYVEIENFKTFGTTIRIELGHPSVLIGPNNAGKTSVIQALALWSRGIKAWYEKKGQSGKKEKRERIAAGINRLNLFELPIQDTRNLWKNTHVHNNKINICVGISIHGEVKPCKLMFTRRDSETIYCKPHHDSVGDDELLEFASRLQFNLLYPMSGIDTQETLLQEGRINVLMGQGQTAQVLRNLAYMIYERSSSDWKVIQRLFQKMFMMDVRIPKYNETNGNLELNYREPDVERDLDISMSGRGVQQLLLILTYLYAHKGCILLIDEPDAHLEILRQKQVYEILKFIAAENECQVIIATHSEVILDDAVDTNLTLLINGSSVDMATQNDMKSALRSIGIEHYYKAKIHPRILYVEGSTDIDMLRALARKLEHTAENILSDRLNYFYTQDIYPADTLDRRLESMGGTSIDYRNHFFTLRRFVEGFKGVAVFDSDGRDLVDQHEDDLAVCYWKNYELENYFITPDVLIRFADELFESEGGLFKPVQHASFVEALNECLLEDVFDGDDVQLAEFNAASRKLQRTLLRNTKMSAFAERIFKQFANKQGQPILMNKGNFYRLVEFVDVADIPAEVTEKLDLIADMLTM